MQTPVLHEQCGDFFCTNKISEKSSGALSRGTIGIGGWTPTVGLSWSACVVWSKTVFESIGNLAIGFFFFPVYVLSEGMVSTGAANMGSTQMFKRPRLV